jgi:hypothetical protein
VKLKYVDSNHAYYLDGKRCKGVSSLAKIPDDTWALDKWKLRQVVKGMGSPGGWKLADEAFANLDSNSKLDEIAEQALEHAGAHDAARAGTAMHDVTERADREQAVETHEELTAVTWQDAFKAVGFQVVPDMIEQVIVYPEQRIAGRYDRYARRLSDGALVVVDLKTGESAVKYPHATAIQLALYGNAPLMAHLPYLEGETEEFSPTPADLDRNTGYMIHMPPGMPATVYAVNLKLGWQAVEKVIFPTLNWRAKKPASIIRAVA